MSFNKKFILKFGAFSTLELLTNQAFGVVNFMILARVMAPDDFGVWILFLGATTLLELGRGSLIKNALIRFLASNGEEDQAKIQKASLVLGVLFFVVSLLLILLPLAYFVGPVLWDAPVLKWMFLMYIPSFFLLIFYSQFKNLQHANFDFKGSFIAAMSRRAPLLILILAAVLFQGSVSLENLVYFQLVSIVSCTLVSFVFGKKFIRYSKSLDAQWMLKIFKFGVFTFGTTMSAMLLRNIDRFMIGAFFNKAVVAVYDTCIRITNLIEIPTNAMSSIVLPKSSGLTKEKDEAELRLIYEKSVAVIFLFVLPIVAVVLVFPEVFILIIAGKQYLSGVDMLRITILFALFVPFIRQSGTVLDAIGKPFINFYLTLMAAVLNIVMNYVFIKKVGAIGAAYGTLGTYIIILGMNQIFLNRYLGVNILNIFRLIVSFYKQGGKMVVKKIQGKK